MYIRAKLIEQINDEIKKEYMFEDEHGDKFMVKLWYILGKLYPGCNAVIKKSEILGEYIAVIKKENFFI